MKTITLSNRSPEVYIEAPGCTIRIRCDLTRHDGRAVTRVDVTASGDRYAGEPQWWALVGQDSTPQDGNCVRVIQGTKEEVVAGDLSD